MTITRLVVQWLNADSEALVKEQSITLSTLPTSIWPDDEQLRTLFVLDTGSLTPGEYVVDISLSTPDYGHIRRPVTVQSR